MEDDFVDKKSLWPDNDYSYLRLRDNPTGTELFRTSRACADAHLDFSQFKIRRRHF